MTGKRDIIALAGFMRQRGESDAAMNRLLADKGLLSFRRWMNALAARWFQCPPLPLSPCQVSREETNSENLASWRPSETQFTDRKRTSLLKSPSGTRYERERVWPAKHCRNQVCKCLLLVENIPLRNRIPTQSPSCLVLRCLANQLVKFLIIISHSIYLIARRAVVNLFIITSPLNKP